MSPFSFKTIFTDFMTNFPIFKGKALKVGPKSRKSVIKSVKIVEWRHWSRDIYVLNMQNTSDFHESNYFVPILESSSLQAHKIFQELCGAQF